MLRHSRRLLLALLFASTAVSQQCFWPNGEANDAAGIPCTQENSASHLDSSNNLGTCCPTDWSCLSNGLCQNPAGEQNQPAVGPGLFGRYGCVNQDGSNCVAACTGGPSTIGAEAVLQCQPGIFCCDRNREAGNCCLQEIQGNDPLFFSLDDTGALTNLTATSSGSVAPTTTSTPISIPADTATPTDSISSTPTPSDTETSQVTTPTPSVSTGAGGSVVTVFITPTATPESSDDSGGSSNTGAIVGGVVGGVVGALLLIGALVFFLWRRRRAARNAAYGEADSKGATPATPATPFNKDFNGSEVGTIETGNGTAMAPVEADSREKAEIDGFPVQKQTKYGELGTTLEEGTGSVPIIELPTTEK